jgi:uncharacterized repeat protein (TIGR03803 family)
MNDGNGPHSMMIAAGGALYGTTLQGGGVSPVCGNYGCGTIFRLTP